MMKAFNFVVITLIVCQKASAGDRSMSNNCPWNAEFTTCGTQCPLTCGNYDKPPGRCIESCFIGCVCKPGYVKNSAGKCVLPIQCKPEERCTIKYEVFKPCGGACPLTCDNYQKPIGNCITSCEPGCACQEGYVRNKKDGTCVKPRDCPPVFEDRCLLDNEEFLTCGSSCPATCKSLKKPPKFCTMECRIGCFCRKGFVRNENGRCVRQQDC